MYSLIKFNGTQIQKSASFCVAISQGVIIEKLVTLTPEEVISNITKSQLSGMGGAFFPTGKKWDLCRKQSAEPKYIVCNADEGEPGTFKDRLLLDQYPALILGWHDYLCLCRGSYNWHYLFTR